MPGFDAGMPERPKGADCKSAGNAFGGSNPSPGTNRTEVRLYNVMRVQSLGRDRRSAPH